MGATLKTGNPEDKIKTLWKYKRVKLESGRGCGKNLVLLS